jgi:4-carboxymuconolactone decarboxylase
MAQRPRLANLTDAEMNDQQKALAAAIGGARRGTVGGPFALWLHSPDICERVNALSERLRAGSTFDKRLYELMVLAVTRVWSAEYAFAAHAPQGVKAGLSQATVDAIAARRTPPFEREDERVLFDTVTELAQTRVLSAASYDRAFAMFGKEQLIELITDAGFYTMLSMMLVTFDVPANNDAHPFP